METSAIVLLDPTAGSSTNSIPGAPRLATIEGATVALLDISKPRGDVLLGVVESELIKRGATVKRYRKPTFAKVAPADLRMEISSQCEAVIEALAD